MIFSPNVTQMWLVRFGGRGEPSTGSTSSQVALVLTDGRDLVTDARRE